jgi:hypothetical protein
MITWSGNYAAAGEYFDEDFLSYPDRVKDLDLAFRIGGWFWTRRGNNYYDKNNWPKNLNEFADVGDFDACIYGVNGGFNGYHERWEYYNRALEVLPENLGIGGDLMFEKCNLVAAADAPWDRAVAYAAGAALNGEGISSLVLTSPENIRAASLAAYHGEVGRYGCLVVGASAHEHLDPVDQPFDKWESGIDTWKCWTEDRSNEPWGSSETRRSPTSRSARANLVWSSGSTRFSRLSIHGSKGR